LATATAVATVSRKGTDFPEMAEVQEFMPEIRLTRLNHL
jgi:fructose-1-phosphate kinase PfkB-like protein